MTPAPVPLAEQPSEEEIGQAIAGLIGVRLNYEAQGALSEALQLIDLARKVCCAYGELKRQHERAMAALREILEEASARIMSLAPTGADDFQAGMRGAYRHGHSACRYQARNLITEMLAALDAANPAVTTEEER